MTAKDRRFLVSILKAERVALSRILSVCQKELDVGLVSEKLFMSAHKKHMAVMQRKVATCERLILELWPQKRAKS